MTRLVVATVVGVCLTPAAAFAAAPGGRPSAKPAVLHQHPHRVSRADPSTRLATGPALTPRLRAAAPALPATVLPAGSWASLGPQPIADEKVFNGPQPTSDYGPASGRVTSLATGPSPSTIYAGTAGGGVWKSTNAGASWSIAASMDSGPSLAIGSLAVDSAGTTIYAATGEANGNADAQWGQGILKSIDSGNTWTAIQGFPFATGTHIGGIAVDRTTSGSTETVLLASDAGLWISHNSGTSWGQINFPPGVITPLSGKTASGGMVQVLQDPALANRFWAVATDFCQTETGDVLVSDDSGATWSSVFTSPVPTSRIAIGVGTDGVAYAALAGCQSSNFGSLVGIYKSDSSGTTWAPVTGPVPNYMTFGGSSQSQGWYDNAVAVDPTNSNDAVFGAITVIRTTTGGQSFEDVGNPYSGGNIHPDFHAFAFTGANTLYAGNDGGIWYTTDLGTSWSNRNANLNTIQFYSGTSPDAAHIVGGAQDNGTPGILPGSPAASPAWQAYLDGDGGYTLLDPTPGSTTIYATTPDGGIFKGSYQPPGAPDPNWPYDTYTDASPCPQPPPSPAPAACGEPTAFIVPVLMDQTAPSRLLTATTRVYQTANGGASWGPISNSLATAPPPPGRQDVIASMVMGAAAGSVKTAFAASYYGALWMNANTDTGAAGWTQINGNLPAFDATRHVPGDGWITGIAVNDSNTSEAWVTLGAVNIGHVWHTTNGGASWTDLSGTGVTGLASGLAANGIIFDSTPTATVYVATELGVVACQTCSGPAATGTWQTVGSGLPHVRVNAISETANHNQLVAWTHGRGTWIVPVGPVLDVSPKQLSFTVGEGGTAPAAQNLTVTNDGAGTLTWTAAATTSPPGQPWLHQPSPPSGSDGSKASTPVSISVDPTGLKAGTYQGSVSFTSNGGSQSVPVSLVVPPFPGRYQPVTPARILDTRYGPGVKQKLQQFEVRTIQVANQGPVPAMNSAMPPSAVVLNVTVTNPTAPGFVTVYPTGVSRPNASNLNFVAGQTVPNLVEVALGADGNVNLYNFQGTTDVVFDVEGWVTTQGTFIGTAGLYRPLSPYRILDTRTGSPLSQGDANAITLQVAGTGGANGVPMTGVSAVVLNVTITRPTTSSFVTVYPTGAGRPNVSNLNFVAGQTVPNRVQVKLGTGGKVTLYNLIGSTDVVVDVNGWFTDGSDLTATGGQLTGVTPYRVLDTRYGPLKQPPLGPTRTMSLTIAGQGGVPRMTDPVPPRAVVLNVTVTDTTAPSFLEVVPGGTPLPGTSDLNWVAGQTVPNLVVVKLNSSGVIDIYNLSGYTDVVVDIVAWYQ